MTLTPEGLVRQAAAQVDLLFQVLCVQVHGGDNAQPPAVGDGGGQLPVGDPGHAPLENGVLDAQKLAQGRFDHTQVHLSKIPNSIL